VFLGLGDSIYIMEDKTFTITVTFYVVAEGNIVRLVTQWGQDRLLAPSFARYWCCSGLRDSSFIKD
jgi:hypothetical protein